MGRAEVVLLALCLELCRRAEDVSCRWCKSHGIKREADVPYMALHNEHVGCQRPELAQPQPRDRGFLAHNGPVDDFTEIRPRSLHGLHMVQRS